MPDLIKKALYFSAVSHDGQYRKGKIKTPYIVHPVEVAMLCMKYTDDQDAIAAAMLHDVLEDCPLISYENIKNSFNKNVADMVRSLTVDKSIQEIDWRKKKSLYIANISSLNEKEILLIACDKMVNMKSYFNAVLDGVDVNKIFNGDISDYVWYYSEVGKVIKSKLAGEKVYMDYFTSLDSYKNKLDQDVIKLIA